MENGSSITFLRGLGSPIKSKTLGQLAAVLACDIKFSSKQPLLDTVEVKEGQEELHREHVWTFNGQSMATFRPDFPEETISMEELVRRFDSAEWCAANPSHPIAYLHVFLRTRNAVVERVKQMKPLEKIVRMRGVGRSFCYIPTDATPEERAAMLAEFEKE